MRLTSQGCSPPGSVPLPSPGLVPPSSLPLYRWLPGKVPIDLLDSVPMQPLWSILEGGQAERKTDSEGKKGWFLALPLAVAGEIEERKRKRLREERKC